MDLRGSLAGVCGPLVDVGGFPVNVDGHAVDVRQILHQVFDRCPIDVGGFPVDVRGSLVDVRGSLVDVRGASRWILMDSRWTLMDVRWMYDN